jgi:8-oxo-dGTP pyrophosphatase MutT (NUDIX family)
MDERNHHIAVTAIIVKNGKYLITKRAGNREAFNDLWTVPGGKIEKSDYERPKDTEAHWYNVLEEALRREVMEELGLEIGDLKYLTNLTFMKKDVPVLVVSMYTESHTGEVKINDESVDHKWVSLEEAKNYDLIEGIYEELEMLDELLRGEKIGEWKKKQDEQEVEVIGVDRFEIKNGFERY